MQESLKAPKRRRALKVIGLLAIFGLLFFFLALHFRWFAAEPVRQGKTVTEWLDRLQLYDYQTNAIGVAVVQRSPERVANDPALQTLLTIGSKAVPVLQARIMDRAQWDPAEQSPRSQWIQWLWKGVRSGRLAKNTPAPENWSEFQRNRKNSAAYVLIVLGTNANAGWGRLVEAYAAAPKHESISGKPVPGPPVGVYPNLVTSMAKKTHPQRRAELVAEIMKAMQHTNAWHRVVALECAFDFPEEFLSWKKEYLACITDKDPMVQGQALLSLMILYGKEKPAAMPISEIREALSQVADDPQTSERNRDIARRAQKVMAKPL